MSSFDKSDGSSFYIPGKLYRRRPGAYSICYALSNKNQYTEHVNLELGDNILMYIRVDDLDGSAWRAWRVFLHGEKLITATWWDSTIIDYSFEEVQ